MVNCYAELSELELSAKTLFNSYGCYIALKGPLLKQPVATTYILCGLVLFGLAIGSFASMLSQAPPANFSYPAKLPYRFDNIVWWDDGELRALLKKRIPGLGDEIATTHQAEGNVRNALTALLKEKGIVAEVQSEEPGPSSFAKLDPDMFGGRPPEQPHPAITFSLLTPKVVIGKVVFKDVSEEVGHVLEPEFTGTEGRPFGAGGNAFLEKRCIEVVERQGYLEAKVRLTTQTPRKDADQYLVDLSLSVETGPKYHVSSLSADGGPLLQGKDMSRFFALKSGDIAALPPFGNLGPQVRALYVHNGYADVDIETIPTLDREHASVAYHMKVTPGPIYHLGSLTIQKLDAAQESKVRELFGIKAGDIYDEQAINQLYRRISGESLLAGLGFGFSPKRDRRAGIIDLTLDFYKKDGEAIVTVK